MSLVELLIGISIITVVFLAIGGGQTDSFISLRKSSTVLEAKTFATRILEDKYQALIKNILDENDPEFAFNEYLKCSEIDFSTINSNHNSSYSCYGIENYDDYDVTWRLSSQKDANNNPPIDLEGLILLEIQVDWEENGEDHSYGLANYFSCTYVVEDDNSNICPDARDPTI